MSKRRLIVNADDFGFTRDVNDGIIEAHREGILTATTLMANGDAFDHAVRLAHQTPSLDIGCHLVIVQGQSVLNPSQSLPPALPDVLSALLRGRLNVYAEFAAQITKIQATGIRPTHLDTHKHTHLLPPVLKAITRAAHDFGIPWVRKPVDFSTGPGFSSKLIALRKPALNRAFKGLRTTDHFAGFQITGSFTEASLIATLQCLPEGLTELMCHPGRLGPELQASTTRLKQSRLIELEALKSPRVKAVIAHRAILLTGYPVFGPNCPDD